MSFIETPRFPDEVAAWMQGGEEFLTDIVMVNSGSEQRNSVWSVPLRRYSLSNGLRTVANAQSTKAFFRAVGGRANGFRVKDILDYNVDVTTGVMGAAGVGTGTPTYQLYKNYIIGGSTSQGAIKKPVAGTFTPYRGGVQANLGSGAGQWAVDTTTGIVTVVADASSAASNISAGNTTAVTLAANMGLIAGQLLYLNGFAGANAASVNGIAHTISTVTGNGPYVFTLTTNTFGQTITLGAGTGYKYPQGSETLTWVGEFDIPVRFDVDWLQVGLDPGGLLNWAQANLIELRNP
jgi:uncharacterized protein (TIGR02217 family)